MKDYRKRKQKSLDKLLVRRTLAAVAQSHPDRKCEGCTVCCTIQGVVELSKPYYETCRHVCNGGCAIYDERPASCRSYYCAWRLGQCDGQRPDQSALLVDMGPVIGPDGEAICFHVYECRPGSLDTDEGERTVRQLSKKGPPVILHVYGDREIFQARSGQPVQMKYAKGVAPRVSLPLLWPE
jgi:hypothetical protein